MRSHYSSPMFAPARTGAVLLMLCVLAQACGGRTAATDDGLESGVVPLEELIEFEPVVVHATVGDDGEVHTQMSDLPSLFAEANDYLRAFDYENSLRLYGLIIDEFEVDEFVRLSHYNSGVANEGLGDWTTASEHYRTVIETWPSTEDATYAMFRLAECHARLGEFERVPALMDIAQRRIELTHRELMEAHLRWGNALLEMRDFAAAEAKFRELISRNDMMRAGWDPESGDARRRPLDDWDGIISQAHFGIGRIYHELFSEIRMVLPHAVYERDLVDKSQLFQQALDGYLASVRTGNDYWSPAAGYMTGQLYEDFYFDILASEIPDHFNELELEVYWQELRAFLQPAIERALRLYQHNLAMAHRLNSDSEWVAATVESVYRLEDYITSQSGWEQEQLLIQDERHPRSAGYSEGMEFRSERGTPHAANTSAR